MSSSYAQQAHSFHAKLKTLLNEDLKRICREEKLLVSGTKVQLQGRIIGLLDKFAKDKHSEGIERVGYRINHRGAVPPASPSNPASSTAYPSSASPLSNSHNNSNNMPRNGGYSYAPAPIHGGAPPPAYQSRIKFRSSPFFEILEALAPPIDLKVLPTTRGSATSNLTLSPDILDRLKSDKNLRVMLYSAADPVLGNYTEMDISFPQQLEVKVNGDQVTSNFKGIKNKAGTTRPADITDFLRKLPKYTNVIQITFALTQKARRFSLVLNLVKKHPVEELVERIKNGNVLSKNTVIHDMAEKKKDPDIVATSTVMSLKDPVSYVRISLPCRSSICMHNQCFDASFFLQLQEQAPTWTCPVCNRVLLFESLVVDQYVQDILMNTSTSTDQVTIDPDGNWFQGNNTEETQNRGTKRSFQDYDDTDDDLVEVVPDDRVKRLKQETSQTPYPLTSTPPISSREQSTTGSAAAANAPGSGSNRQKRKSEVIDLTLSDDDDDDDDDDEPPRPAQRGAYNTSSSLPDPGPDRSHGFTPLTIPPSASSRHPHPGVRSAASPHQMIGRGSGGSPYGSSSANGRQHHPSAYGAPVNARRQGDMSYPGQTYFGSDHNGYSASP